MSDGFNPKIDIGHAAFTATVSASLFSEGGTGQNVRIMLRVDHPFGARLGLMAPSDARKLAIQLLECAERSTR